MNFHGLNLIESIALLSTAAVLWIYIMRRWQIGLYGLMCYIPIAGVVSLKLYPALWPRELADFLFILPTYLAFAGHPKIWKSSRPHIPRAFLGILGALILLVLVQAFNPHVLNWRIAVIGIKVWLFYLPLVILGYFWIETRVELLRLLRLLIILSWIPTTVGFIQFVGTHWYGYEPFMRLIYGNAAGPATQHFSFFALGEGVMLRIPATFTFPTQYLNYLFAMIVVSYTLVQSERDFHWKYFSNATFYWILLASFLSGARVAFVLTPILVTILCLWDKRWFQGISKILGVMILMYIALTLPKAILLTKASIHNQIDIIPIENIRVKNIQKVLPISNLHRAWSTRTLPMVPVITHSATIPNENKGVSLRAWGVMMKWLIVHDPKDIGYMTVVEALRMEPLGLGTGMNTGAARYSLVDPTQFLGFENYYAKTIAELGILGGAIIMILFSSLLIYGFRICQRLFDPLTRHFGASVWTLLTIFVIYNFKGFVIDLDPINIYFWLFTGMLFRLPYLA